MSTKGSKEFIFKMKVAIITPYWQEPDQYLSRCINSVRQQNVAVDHFLVADGHPKEWIHKEGLNHIVLDKEHSDYGNTPRCIGAMTAISRAYDAISFLDADNWLEPDHVSSCIQAAKENKNVDYVVAKRRFVRSDGSTVHWPSEPISQLVDTSCFFLLPSSYHVIPTWINMPKALSVHGDRIFLAGLNAHKLQYIECTNITVNYLCTDKNIYIRLGEIPPSYSKEMNFQPIKDWLEKLTPDIYEKMTRRLGFRLSGIGTNRIIGTSLY